MYTSYLIRIIIKSIYIYPNKEGKTQGKGKVWG
jgi:hypothetical protein